MHNYTELKLVMVLKREKTQERRFEIYQRERAMQSSCPDFIPTVDPFVYAIKSDLSNLRNTMILNLERAF